MDSRKKKVVAVLSLASAVLVWRVYVVIAQYLPKSAQAEAAVASVEDQAGSSPPAPGLAESRLAERWATQTRVAAGPWGSDPFIDKPWVEQISEVPEEPEEAVEARRGPPSAPAIRFTGASKSGEQWLAIIGSSIVRVGDTLEGAFTVTEITKQSITLTSDSWSFTYYLGSEEPLIGSRGGDQ